MNREQDEVRRIPIDKIAVPNPRTRGKKKFKQIVANIAQIVSRGVTGGQFRGIRGPVRAEESRRNGGQGGERPQERVEERGRRD